jgi:hypothetical protein
MIRFRNNKDHTHCHTTNSNNANIAVIDNNAHNISENNALIDNNDHNE